jgi:hypothetical protein
MYQRVRMGVCALVAAVVCSLAAGSASANRSIEVRGGSGITAESRITFGGTERSATRTVICDITLMRTVTSRIPKTNGTQFGSVTGVQIDRTRPVCRHGSFIREITDITPLAGGRAGGHTEDRRARLLYTVTWELVYDGFQGTLPRIEGVNIHVSNYQTNLTAFDPFGGSVECLYEGNVFGLIPVTETGVASRASVVTERTALNRVRGGTVCPARATFEGEFNLRPTLTIALI